MFQEIERKFIVKKMPDLSAIAPVTYERYFLYNQNGIELRIQRKGETYELERKTLTNSLTRKAAILPLTPKEFNLLKQLSSKAIIREAYLVNQNPEIDIKIYHGDYEGLVRAEVEFASEAEAKAFTPLDWFGSEITDSPIGKDGKLIALSRAEFLNIFNSIVSQ